MNLFQPLPGIERVSPVKACGLDVESTQGLSGRPYDPSRALSKHCCYNRYGCGNIRNGRAMRAPTGYGDAAVGCKRI